MRWEDVKIQPTVTGGPGKRWGHSCNSINGGKLLYVFGGYGQDNRQTNQVHIFDTVRNTWSEPEMKGVPPLPRDSHSCTTVGDKLFVFGGTDGTNPFNDLHVLDTTSNTWILPSVTGEIPPAREGHSASAIGNCLFIFGGSGKSAHTSQAEYYNDLFILNTDTFVWKCAQTSGIPPVRRCTHTCSSWKNKIIVIGGEDSNDYYLSDVNVLDTDTLVWNKLNTSGQPFSPRAGHSTVALGKNLFIFGGFADESSLYDDIFMLDIDIGVWTKLNVEGSGPSARFSSAGDIIDQSNGGIIVLIGGCNKNLEALGDMYYMHTGLPNKESERRLETLSLRKKLKLKCQEQNMFIPFDNDKAPARIDTPVPVTPKSLPNFAQSNRYNMNLNVYEPLPGRVPFEGKVTKIFQGGYNIETVIDGKPLRGVVFYNNPSANANKSNNNPSANADKYNNNPSANADKSNSKRKRGQKSNVEAITTPMQDSMQEIQATNDHKIKMEPSCITAMKSPEFNSYQLHQAEDAELSMNEKEKSEEVN